MAHHNIMLSKMHNVLWYHNYEHGIEIL